MKAHIFLIANLKFHLQTPCSFGDMAENVKLIGIPINNFLCIYIIASSPGLHTLFCLWRVNKKLPQGETSQNTFQRSRSISWKCKIHMVKWAHPPLKTSKTDKKVTKKWKKWYCHFSEKRSCYVAELSKTESFPLTSFSQMNSSWWKVRKNRFQKTFLVL